MEIKAVLDAEEDLPENSSIESRDQAENFMQMMQGTIESLMEEADYVEDSGNISVRMDAIIDGRGKIFSLNDERWCVLCHNCYEIVAKDEDAQVAREIFNEHIDDDSIGCIDRNNKTILNSYQTLKEIRNAMRDDS